MHGASAAEQRTKNTLLWHKTFSIFSNDDTHPSPDPNQTSRFLT